MVSTSRSLESKPHVETMQVGIDAAKSAEIASSLGKVLGDTYRLLIKTHVHHWNVVGPIFYPLHLLLETQYQDLFEATDTLAERIRALGIPAPFPEIGAKGNKGTIEKMSAEQIVEDLIADNEAICRFMRDVADLADEADDIVTNDMLVQRLAVHEKAIWMLRSTISA